MITFNKPYMAGKELTNIKEAYRKKQLGGDGAFTKLCHNWLKERTLSKSVLLVHSCTAALEMTALLLNIQPGDEVIMPSFTFVSTANSFVLRGAVPVFVDIREDTLNIDEKLIEAAITPLTRAIVVVHYAGVSCEMDSILDLAKKYGLPVVEDAAQGILASYKKRPLGSMGTFGTYSFHETKNIISGEGGALLINNESFVTRAEIIREKGTDRSRFLQNKIDKYTWQDTGSSFLTGELISAFLYAQLEFADEITKKRLALWSNYHKLLEPIERTGLIRRPKIPNECQHNGHIYYVLLDSGIDRQFVIDSLLKCGIMTLFHYVPLHSSPGGLKYGRFESQLNKTENQAKRLLRLPIWIGLTNSQQEQIVDKLFQFVK